MRRVAGLALTTTCLVITDLAISLIGSPNYRCFSPSRLTAFVLECLNDSWQRYEGWRAEEIGR